ncbi:MAG: hypothetical protein C4524_15210 [Candidatus Zixiibacteriota bacterium]|nr:MAG: hypothetical protein C4524_15210 [candidate division Zixibacteria bacterium]
MSALREDLTAFRELDAEVFGVNPAGPKSHDKFLRKLDLPFPLLVDEGGRITEAYGARKTPAGGTKRTVYLVDKFGIVRYARRGAPADPELLEALREMASPPA